MGNSSLKQGSSTTTAGDSSTTGSGVGVAATMGAASTTGVSSTGAGVTTTEGCSSFFSSFSTSKGCSASSGGDGDPLESTLGLPGVPGLLTSVATPKTAIVAATMTGASPSEAVVLE
jgi:hypothetical protein